MYTGFVKPSHNYNIVLTEEDLKVLLEKGYLLMCPTKTKTTFFDGSIPINKRTESNGHSLTYDDPAVENADVQFLTINLDSEYYTKTNREKPDSKQTIRNYIMKIIGGKENE